MPGPGEEQQFDLKKQKTSTPSCRHSDVLERQELIRANDRSRLLDSNNDGINIAPQNKRRITGTSRHSEGQQFSIAKQKTHMSEIAKQ